MGMTATDFRRRMKRARLDAGMSLRETGHAMGLGANTIKDMETGRTPFPVHRLYKLCEIYNVHPIWAISGLNPNFDAQRVVDLVDEIKEEMQRGT